MPDFYYQIKGCLPEDKRGEGMFNSNWAWPPLFSDKVEAASKAEAKRLVELEYGRKFPLRVLAEDLNDNAFLLHITEMSGKNDSLREQFELNPCKQCGLAFRIIDKFNNPKELDNGRDYCTYGCATEARLQQTKDYQLAASGSLPATIYLIRQISSGKCYVGQTTRPLTLRWWQHLAYPSDSKFHKALKATQITDWTFQALETIALPSDFRNKAAYITDRERFWIDHYDSVNGGYNTVLPSALCPQTELDVAESPALEDNF